MKYLVPSFFILFFSSFFATAEPFNKRELNQTQKEPQIELMSPYSQIQKGKSFVIALRMRLPQDWHSYWSFSGDFGQAPKIKWAELKNVKISSLPFPTPIRKSENFGKSKAHSFIYKKEVLLFFNVFIEEDYTKKSLPIAVDIEWFVCKDICFSNKNSLQLELPLGKDSKIYKRNQTLFNFWKEHLPQNFKLKSTFQEKEKWLLINFSFEEEIKCLDIFPKNKESFSTKVPQLLSQTSNFCSFQIEKSNSSLPKISGLLVYSKEGKEQSSLFDSQKQEDLALLWFIFMAFLGGLLLNIMPCVLPIIFLKFYNTLEFKNLSSRKILFLNVSYSCGVILSFLFLAFVILISKQVGENLGWGFHLQSPLFVTFLIFLFTFMALYLLNLFNFSFPKISLFAKEEKLFSHFMTGVLSTTAASPCTVPFMASAMGFAFSRSSIEIFVIFFFLGLGLSFPYLLLSFFPKAFKYVPSPNRWTEILKKTFSIPLFLTALWLLRILYLQLSLQAFLVSLLIFPLILLWIVLQKNILNKKLRQIVTLGFFFLIIALIASQKIFPKGLKGLKSKYIGLSLKERQRIDIKNRNWLVFDSEFVSFDKQQGHNVFVSFGAEWCLTCKLNERIFEKEEFQQLVKEKQIHLYYGDWTSKNLEITNFLDKYGQKGVPFYVFFRGEEKVFIFPTLLFKDSFFKKLKSLSEEEI